MHSVIIEWGGDKFFSGVTMGAAEEELGVESEMTKRGEAYQVGGKIAGCDLSSVADESCAQKPRTRMKEQQ